MNWSLLQLPLSVVNTPQLNTKLLNSLMTQLQLNQSESESYMYVTTDGRFYSLANIHGKYSLLASIHGKCLLPLRIRGTFVDSVHMESAFRAKSVSTNPHLHRNVC
jgi:hypothetical protein